MIWPLLHQQQQTLHTPTWTPMQGRGGGLRWSTPQNKSADFPSPWWWDTSFLHLPTLSVNRTNHIPSSWWRKRTKQAAIFVTLYGHIRPFSGPSTERYLRIHHPWTKMHPNWHPSNWFVTMKNGHVWTKTYTSPLPTRKWCAWNLRERKKNKKIYTSFHFLSVKVTGFTLPS